MRVPVDFVVFLRVVLPEEVRFFVLLRDRVPVFLLVPAAADFFVDDFFVDANVI